MRNQLLPSATYCVSYYPGHLLTSHSTLSDMAMCTSSVSRDVLQLKYGTTCKIFTQQLTLHETSSSTALLKSVSPPPLHHHHHHHHHHPPSLQLVRALTLLLEAQSLTTWETSHCQKVFQTILHFTIYPKPKVTSGPAELC